jgi:hypothetical protein
MLGADRFDRGHLLAGGGAGRCGEGAGFGQDVGAHVSAGFGPFVVCSISTAPARRMTAAQLGKMPTTSVLEVMSWLGWL